MRVKKEILIITALILFMVFLNACKQDSSILNLSKDITNEFKGIVFYQYTDSLGTHSIPIKGAIVSIATATQSFTQYSDKDGNFKFNKDDFNNINYSLRINTGYFDEYIEVINPVNFEGEKIVFIKKDNEIIKSSSYIGRIIINQNFADNINVKLGINSCVTDDKGYFKFTNITQGIYDFKTNQTSGFSDINKKLKIDGDYIWVNNIIELLKPQVVVEGKIFDSGTGQIIPEVEVEISILSDYYYYNKKIVTDSNGEFRLANLVTGNYIFIYEKEFYITGSIEVNISNSTDRNKLKSLKLTKINGDLQITVLDSNTKLPARGVKVKLDDENNEYLTDVSGRVFINDISMRSHDIQIYSYLYDTYETTFIMDELFKSDTYEIVYKERKGIIRGKIFTDDEGTISALNISPDERELRAFSVYSMYEGQKRLTEFRPVKYIDDNEFYIKDLPSGIFVLEATYIVTQAQATVYRSAGSYVLNLPDFPIPINTGDEINVVVNLKKTTGE
ncbi:MAG: hypothetical protein M0R46_08080 [Candidatus Muirbacterium halophilum]|nr:hypothetical protein [Candidatus Muirbacterium halophilum]